MPSPYSAFFLRCIFVMAALASIRSADARPGHRRPALDVAVSDRPIDVGPLGPNEVASAASMTALGDGAVLAFQVDSLAADNTVAESRLSLVTLDASFRRRGAPITLSLCGDARGGHAAQEPKLLWLDDQLLLLFSQRVAPKQDAPRRMHIARLRVESAASWVHPYTFTIERCARIAPPAGVRLNRVERGWTPFAYEGLLWLLYRSNPPSALGVDAASLTAGGDGLDTFGPIAKAPQVSLPSGVWLGGTPALPIEPHGDLEMFVTLSDRVGSKSYANIGYAILAAEPPFAIRDVVPVPLVVPELEVDSSRLLSHAVPGGFLRRGEHVYVAYSRHDRAIHLLTVDAHRLSQHVVSTSVHEDRL